MEAFFPTLGSRAADRARGPWRRTIAVGGGNLGVGASTMAALLALATAAMGQDTLLVEGHPDDGALGTLLGIRRDPREVGGADGGALVRVRERLTLLRAESGAGGYPAVARRAALYERYDVVFVDAGWRLDALLETCAADAERVIVVTTPGRTALSSAYGLLKAVEMRFPGTSFEILANQQDRGAGKQTFEHLNGAALSFLGRGLVLAGVVPDDACLRAGTRGGMTVEDAAADSEVSRAVEQVALRLLSELGTPQLAAPPQRNLLGGA